MPKNSGKDRGSISQTANDQQVRISQVSNVSKAVTEMGKKTTNEMKETERKIAAGGDINSVSGSMNSVLGSLKRTVDSLQNGVEAATFGTAKAAQEAIKQYGQAISEDFKINKQNMVASALASATPIFGYFASKFMETGMFKTAKDKMAAGMTAIFRRKSQGGSIPDDIDMSGGYGVAKSATKAKTEANNKKKDTIDTFKIIDKNRHKEYGRPENEKMIMSLSAIQSALGGQIGKFSQWYSKFLLQHPYFRTTMTAMKALSAGFGAAWKAVYFFWKPRGGYGRQLSKSKQPLVAINQNIATLFVQSMPRLDAIMIYTKATAMAIRDLSSHVTGIKYPMMDPSKLGGTWSIAGSTMKALRKVGAGMMKAGTWGVGKLTTKGSQTEIIISEILNSLGLTAQGIDYALTGPGRLRAMIKKKSAGAIEGKRLFGGLEATGGPMEILEAAMGGRTPITDSSRLLPAPKKESLWKRMFSKIRMPKFFRGMGRKQKPQLIVQGVYDEWYANRNLKKDKHFKKLLGYTANTSKYLKQHDKREKRRTTMGIIGSIFGGAKNILSGALGLILPLLATFKGGVSTFIKGFFGKGGIIRTGIGALFAVGGPILAALSSAWFWGPIGAAIGGYGIGKWTNDKIIKPYIMDPFFKNQQTKQQEGGSVLGQVRKTLQKEAKTGTGVSAYEARIGLKVQTMFKNQQTLIGDSLAPNAVKAGQLKYVQANKSIYAKYSVDEIQKARERWRHSGGYTLFYRWMSQGRDPMTFGREKEEHFLNYLQKVGTPLQKGVYAAKIIDYDERKIAMKGGKKWLGLVSAKQARELVATYGGEAKDYINKKYTEAVTYGKRVTEKTKELSDKYGGAAIQKTGEFIELGKGTFLEIYRQGDTKLKEFWETSSPEKKAIIKRQAEQLLASGEVTAAELKRMGITLKDSAAENAEKVGKAVVSSAIHTTNNISNAVNNISGGGSGGSNKFIQEQTMDDIARGEMIF
jgi:hypothetical protein